ncbi:MAG: hypothetical protein CMH41_04145 [Micrococcales bacterium]|nr:hypothetical protein [Micrococcales bacterium]
MADRQAVDSVANCKGTAMLALHNVSTNRSVSPSSDPVLRYRVTGLAIAGLLAVGLSGIAAPPASSEKLQAPSKAEITAKKKKKPRVQLSSSATSGNAGDTVKLSGRAKGLKKKKKKKNLVLIQQKDRARWTTAAKAQINAKGRFTTQLTLPKSRLQLEIRAKTKSKKLRPSNPITLTITSESPVNRSVPAPVPGPQRAAPGPGTPPQAAPAKDQTVRWLQDLNSAFPAVGEVVTLRATSTSGNKTSFTSSNPAVASISGSTVTFGAKGSATITARVEGSATWKPAAANIGVTVAATLVRGNGASLQSAVAAAPNGETLKLAGAFDLTEFDRPSAWSPNNVGLVVDKNLTLFGGSITQTLDDTAIGVKSGAELTLTGGIRIIGSDINQNAGAGIYNLGSVVLSDGTITNGRAGAGGGIYNTGTVTLNGGSINGNGAAQTGGGIFNDTNGVITLNGTTITDNRATTGGGIYNNGGTIKLNDGRITGNSASNSGGIYDPTRSVTDPKGIVTENTGGNIGP